MAEHTVESLTISASEAPKEMMPISCENSAKLGFDKSGTWPKSSWTQSLYFFV